MRLQVGDIWASSTWPPWDELQKLLTKFVRLGFLNRILTFDNLCLKITLFSTSCLSGKKWGKSAICLFCLEGQFSFGEISSYIPEKVQAMGSGCCICILRLGGMKAAEWPTFKTIKYGEVFEWNEEKLKKVLKVPPPGILLNSPANQTPTTWYWFPPCFHR